MYYRCQNGADFNPTKHAKLDVSIPDSVCIIIKNFQQHFSTTITTNKKKEEM